MERDPFHHERIARSAAYVPRATNGSRLVDVGTDPVVLHVIAETAGYEAPEGVDLSVDQGPSWSVSVGGLGSGASREYLIHNVDIERQRLPFDDASVDVVTSFETLEHLLDPMHFLFEVNRILKQGGTLVLTTPNAISWRSMLRGAVHKHPLLFPFLARELNTNRHNIEYIPSMVRAMTKGAGFEGDVSTREWWYHIPWWQKLRLTLVGFRPGDRGDIITVKVQKRAAPSVRYPPEVYL